MSDTEVRRLFEAALKGPLTDTTDIDEAVRSGRRRRRRRRATATVLSAVGVVVVLLGVTVSGALPGRDRVAPTATTPPASSAPVSPSAAPPEGELVTDESQLVGTWLTVQLSGRDVSNLRDRSGDPLYLEFGRFSGEWGWGANDGCNQHFGNFAVGRAGTFRTVGDGSTLVACLGGLDEPANVSAVTTADQARILAATGTGPARLFLSKDGTLTAVYDLYSQSSPGPRTYASTLTSGAGDGSGRDALVTGVVTVNSADCVTLDGATTIWPDGTSWSGVLGALLLPDGTTVTEGQTVSGAGVYLAEVRGEGLARGSRGPTRLPLDR